MSDNQRHLSEAQEYIKKFEAELEPERLRETYMALDNVLLAQERDLDVRDQLRASVLSLWLQLINILDNWLDPKFNPNDAPESLVQPPPTSEGVVYPPGADSTLIDDPQARAEYEKAISANRAQANNYRMQVYLHRLSERIPLRVEAYIRYSYTSSTSDQNELRIAIERMVNSPRRKAELLKLLMPSQP